MVQVEGIAPPMPISRRRVYSTLHCCCDPLRPRCGHPRGSPLAGSGLRPLRAAALRLPHLDTTGSTGRIRTDNLRLMRATLCSLSYRAVKWWRNGEESWPPGTRRESSGTWTRTTILRSKAACPTIRRSRNERGESGQADGICTRFPAFTGRCPSDWAACLKVMVRAGRFALPIPRSQAECVGCYATPG